VLEEMLKGLGATVTHVDAAFDPEPSPHGHEHSHGA
jgi:urease accessory protein